MGYNNPWMSKLPFSRFFKEPVTKLGEDLSKYVEYLIHKRVETPQNQELDCPIINENNNGQLKILAANIRCMPDNIIKYRSLLLALQAKQYWQPILVDDFCSSIVLLGSVRVQSGIEPDSDSKFY